MATVLSAALESFPYNSEINNGLCQDSWTTQRLTPVQGILQKTLNLMMMDILWGAV